MRPPPCAQVEDQERGFVIVKLDHSFLGISSNPPPPLFCQQSSNFIAPSSSAWVVLVMGILCSVVWWLSLVGGYFGSWLLASYVAVPHAWNAPTSFQVGGSSCCLIHWYWLAFHNIIHNVEPTLQAQHFKIDIHEYSGVIPNIVQLSIWISFLNVYSRHTWLNPIEAWIDINNWYNANPCNAWRSYPIYI